MPSPFQSVRPALYARLRDVLRIGNTVSRMEIAPSVQPVTVLNSVGGAPTFYDTFVTTAVTAPGANADVASFQVPETGYYSVISGVGQDNNLTADTQLRLQVVPALGSAPRFVIWQYHLRAGGNAVNNQRFEGSIPVDAGNFIQLMNTANQAAGLVIGNLCIGRL